MPQMPGLALGSQEAAGFANPMYAGLAHSTAGEDERRERGASPRRRFAGELLDSAAVAASDGCPGWTRQAGAAVAGHTESQAMVRAVNSARASGNTGNSCPVAWMVAGALPSAPNGTSTVAILPSPTSAT